MQKTIEVVTKLAQRGVIEQYAIAGAIAAIYYTELTHTEDLDILVSIAAFESRPSGLILLGPIDKALADMGYTERTDVGIKVEGWPVQFLPVGSLLEQEALDQAVEVEIDAAMVRCLRAEHLVAIALNVGRYKDLARVQAFLEQDAVDLAALKDVLERHNLMDKWKAFCTNADIANPL
jgi:hypothetical protein